MSNRSDVADLNLAVESARLETVSPIERLAFAVERWSATELLFTSSFGAGSAVLLHMWSEVARTRSVVLLDTGFLFEETLRYKDGLAERLGLTVEIARPAEPKASFLSRHGEDIYRRDPDFCCAQNKVAPLVPYRARARAWISGLRRDQSAARARTRILEKDGDDPIHVHPLATMTATDADAYMKTHGLPEHPLRARRYLSIGCEPCTRAVLPGEDERAGRWAWSAKTECGLHGPRDSERGERASAETKA